MSTRSEAAHSSAARLAPRPVFGLALAFGLALGAGLAGCAADAPAGHGAVVAGAAAAPISTASADRPAPATSPSTSPTAARVRATGRPGAQSTGAAGDAADVALASLPGWPDDRLDGLTGAIERQCALARPLDPWPLLCEEFRAQRVQLRAWLERRFLARPLAGADGATEGLITGYFEAELVGSRRRMSARQVPLYRRPPPALIADRPTRARIESSSLLAGHELAWIDDPVEAFFLQVQGSGRIRLHEGGTMRVGYAGDNGRPYLAIGRVLIERGAIPASEVDAASIKAWLRANPAQARSVMHANARYIFFRELPPVPDDVGPPGSLGVALTPMRSVAVDPSRVPRGALLYVDTTHPVDGGALQRVVVAQDTGAAIVGTVRADLFWGHGPEAERAAGLMKQRGRLWLLVPRD